MGGGPSGRGHEGGHAWLAAVIPAHARRFHVRDAELARTLAAAGAQLNEPDPEVEIGSSLDLEGEAPCAIVAFDASQPEGGGPLVRLVRRLAAHLRVRRFTARARRTLRERGYDTVHACTWDLGHVLRLPHVRTPPRPLRLSERLPQRVVVVGRRGPPAATAIDAAHEAASRRLGAPLGPVLPLAKSGLMVVVAEEGVLRVAVGPARHRIDGQAAALESLEALDPPPAVRERTPWLLARGRAGVAEWSLERRLPGKSPPRALGDRLLEDCIEFLAVLHAMGPGQSPAITPSSQAELIAETCDGQTAQAVRALGEQLDGELADFPRGYAHGDFHHGNLLHEGGRLTGVIDWDSAGPGRIPVLDLLHLRLNMDLPPRPRPWGSHVVELLLPWAADGGDHVLRAYCGATGLTIARERLHALVVAYWLDRVAYQLATYSDRTRRPIWMEHNVHQVVRALRPHVPVT